MSPSELAQALHVVPATRPDFDAVMQLLAEARMLQIKKGLNVWKAFDPALIAADLEAGGIWDTNRKLRTYYEQQGFRHIRDVFFPSDSPIPEGYRGTRKSLYELAL